jgi:DNA-directed RNA polymerase specialized sigma24 family protein
MVGTSDWCIPPGEIDSTQYVAYKSVCRAAAAGWARSHPEFDGAADLAIVEALRAYDPVRGVTLKSFMYLRARSRIPTLLARWDQRASCLATLDELEGEVAVATGNVSPDVAEIWERTYGASASVRQFVALLPRRQRAVALRIASGMTPSEVATTLGVTVSAVCNSLRDMRPRASAHFGSVPADMNAGLAA